MFQLTITKIEYTKNGINLDKDERWTYKTGKIFGNIDQDVAIHETVLLDKTFKTGKSAWAYCDESTLDSFGLVWNACAGNYHNDFSEYYVTVEKVK